MAILDTANIAQALKDIGVAIDSSQLRDLNTQRLTEALLAYIALNGSGGSNSGITPGQVTAAIQAASNLDNVEPLLTAIGSGQITPAQVQAALESALAANPELDNLVTASATTIPGQLTSINNSLQPSATSRLGGVSPSSDIAVSGRLRRVVCTNNSASNVFIGVYSKGAALTTGDLAASGEIYPVPAGSVLILGAADLGEKGAALPANARIGVSSVLGSYTAATMANITLFLEAA